ncbi:uncharacterized protein LOC128677074 isoform X2 [Plodia interpunctella]|nr:uncharacterized protein LOC128677074 isoform X2 [Plodia interpunctella]XP_053613636.1 uncharacterized protein LOC128677074 isoform X2 [Plodia interpunctella]
MASTPKQVNGSNNGLLGKRKKPKRTKGSYLTKWLDKTMQHIQDATPSMDTYEPFVNTNSNWPITQFAPGYEPCRYNMYGCAEPMSLPTLPTYYNPAMPPFYNPEYRYQPVDKSVQVQRPRPRRCMDQKAEEVNTPPNSTLSNMNYLQPKNFTDSQDYASLPPIVTSVGDTNSNSDLHTNDKDDCSNTRRFSDPCVRGLPDVARPNGEVESDSESNSSFSGSQIGSRLLGHLLDQIASLKLANDRLNKELFDTRAELEGIRQHNVILQKGQSSSVGATPSHPHLNDNGVTGGHYSPGFLADLVREIRDAARVREEALYSRVRAMVIERTDSGLASSEAKYHEKTLEEVKSSLRASDADKRRMMDRIVKLEDDIRHLRVSSGFESNENKSNGNIEDGETERVRLRKEVADMRRAKQHAEDHALK